MKTITLKVDDCDQIVIDDLKESFRMNNRIEKIELSDMTMDPDYELLKAIQTVLAHYMPYQDYEEWVSENPIAGEE